MVYFAYGFPRALRTGCEEAPGSGVPLAMVYASFAGSDLLVVVSTFTVQTDQGCLHFYGLHVSKEVLWHSENGQDSRRVAVYLQNSLSLEQLQESGISSNDAVAALCGDPRSLLVVLASGQLLALSWQGAMRGTAQPLVSAPERPRSHRYSRARRAGSVQTKPAQQSMSPFSPPDFRPPSRQGSEANSLEMAGTLDSELSLGTMASEDSFAYFSVSAFARSVAVTQADYAPATSLLALVLQDGRVALVQLPTQGGLAGVERAHLLRWAYTPPSPDVGAVAAAIQPGGHFLAVGLLPGRVALFTLPAVATPRTAGERAASIDQPWTPLSPPPVSTAQAEPVRSMSLNEWGYSSAAVGAAHLLQWSPDGRVFAVGYARSGIAVWTASGCRVMCSLRQAAQGSRSTADEVHGSVDAARQLSTEEGRREEPSLSLTSSLSDMRPTPDTGILEGGIVMVAWAPHGYSLLTAEANNAGTLLELSFARGLMGQHRAADGPRPQDIPSSSAADAADPTAAATARTTGPVGRFVLQGADRLLLVTESLPLGIDGLATGLAADADVGPAGILRPGLSLQHVRLPQQYLDSAYPVATAAPSGDGRDVAVAGARGLAIYNCRAKRWRLFGDTLQERRIRATALAWLPGGIVAACAMVDGSTGASAGSAGSKIKTGGAGVSSGDDSGPAATLLLYPRDHLDASSLLATLPLPQLPLAVDSVGPYLALAFAPLQLRLLRADLGGGGSLRPGSVTLTTVRELSILSMSGALQQLCLVPDPLTPAGGSTPRAPRRKATKPGLPPLPSRSGGGRGSSSGSDRGAAHDTGPARCVLLREGGIMSVLDMQQGSEVLLADEIEAFWLPPALEASTEHPAAAPSPGAEGSGASLILSPVHRGDSAADLQASPAAKSAAWLEHSAPSASASLKNSGALTFSEQQPTFERLVEMPWWTYGARGMQLWFASTLPDPALPSAASGTAFFSPRAAAGARGGANQTDPELEFDKEVYPLGVSLAEVSIVGVTQRTVRNAAFPADSPLALCFHPHPESQPVLPCLLRRLLDQGRAADALELAMRHSGGPHFARSLEWLLFTALDADADAPRDVPAAARRVRFVSSLPSPGDPNQLPFAAASSAAGRQQAGSGPLLLASALLVQQFPQFAEIVVSVARKTDAALWPALFAAAGSPAGLCEGLIRGGALRSAACCLVIVDHVEGTAMAHELALRLVRGALAAGSFELSSDLLRFLMPPEEAEWMGNGAAPAAAPVQEQQQQQQAQQQPTAKQTYAAWLWSFFTGEDLARPAAAAQPAPPLPLPRPVSVSAFPDDAAATPASTAWRVMGRHAWKLLDSGALRELAALRRAAAQLPGGLPSLLASTAAEVPLSIGHTSPSAAAMASALFVTSNEFSTADVDPDVAAAADQLRVALTEAGCVNHTAALAMMLGQSEQVEGIRQAHPGVWATFTDMIANDVHLCSFTPMLSQPGTPLVLTGTAPYDWNAASSPSI